MDKNKDRTDLLAAGRKKLQQFRKKKDGKGNSSKSSGKAGKSGHDKTSGTSTGAAVAPQNVADIERLTDDAKDTIALSESSSKVDSGAIDTLAASNELSEKTGIVETASLAGPAEFPVEASGLDETRSSVRVDAGPDVDSGPLQASGSSSFVPENAEFNEPGTSDPIIGRVQSADSSGPLPIHFSSKLEKQLGEEQVTDVGATQEVSSSSRDQIDKGMVMQPEGDGSLPPVDLSDTTTDDFITDSRVTRRSERDHTSLISDATYNRDETLEGSSVPMMTDQLREGLSSGLSHEQTTSMLNVSGGYGGDSTEGTHENFGFVDSKRSLELRTDDNAKSLGCKQVDLSSVLDGSSIRLSQLVEILQKLNEDDFEFLFMSRESPLEKVRGTSNVHESVTQDIFEKLKEQLYVTSFSRDALHLQFSEQQKLIDEMYVAKASLNEVQRKNEIFAEEIVRCRHELQEVVVEREELQKQLFASKAEIGSFTAKVNELQTKLELAQVDMASLSSEVVDGGNLVEALWAENENLNRSLLTLSEEKQKLLEENGITLLEKDKVTGEFAQCRASLESLQKEIVDLSESLTLLRYEKRCLEEEKDFMIHENNGLCTNLAVYKSTIEALEAENGNLSEMLIPVSEDRKKLEEEKELVVDQMAKLSKELTDRTCLVATLQKEISSLKECLTLVTEENQKLQEDGKSSLGEYDKQQSREVTEIQVSEDGLKEELEKSLDDLKEARNSVSQLIAENKMLKTDLEFQKFKIKEFDEKMDSSQAEEVSSRGIEEVVLKLQPKSDWSSLQQLKLDVYDDSSGFIALKRDLRDAGTVMQKLEKAIEDMHLHVTSLSKSSDKVAAPAVSRLIQAFESKGHTDDQDPEEHASFENQKAEDPYMRTKMVTQNLGALINELVLDAEKASQYCRVMHGTLLAVTAGTELRSVCDVDLRKHTDLVEEANIELMVLYEVMRQNVSNSVAKEGELLVACDVLQKQELLLKSQNSQLREKLHDCQAKISNLESQLDGIAEDTNEMVATFSNQVQNLQAAVVDRESSLEEEWHSVVAKVLQRVGELDSTVNTFSSNSLSGGDHNLDVVDRVAASIFGAIKVIEGLHGELEAAREDRQSLSDACTDMHEKCSRLQVKNEMALGVLHRLCNELHEIVNRTFGHYSDERENPVVDDKVLDLFEQDAFNTLLDHLKSLSGEKLHLELENKQLNLDLMNRDREINELETKCLKSDTIMKLLEEIEQSSVLECMEINVDEPSSRLESLIYLLVQKCKEANEGLSLSTSLEMQLSDLQTEVEHLHFILVQYENENLVFKHSLKSAEDVLDALNSKLQEKVAELEQSEHRVLSLREKLSIAVSKGKGLILQRDSLKQSLSETSKELEKCSQELLFKDARLDELETKLKLYSEAGERMEALESELTYIRNSATALRESFLLKDSVLQRVEEILEDLELPEHFHARDIIEKIDWLAKSAASNSLPLGEWDQRSSLGGGSHSDAGFVGVDGLKEDMQQNLVSGDDLRKQYEELQSKFYELAEQNEMLEQSLMERNNLVQQWEEILSRVDMPSQLRSMEPEDKIQWLGSALTEAQDHCSSLQQKIDNLERSCGSLTADMEESHRRISELELAFHQACAEKEILSRDLEILNHDNDKRSKETDDYKMRIDNLEKEVRLLQEEKLRIEETFQHSEDVIRRLQELVKDTLHDSITDDVVLGQESVISFEEMMRKLVENYKTLSSEKPINLDPIDVHVTERAETQVSEEQDVAILSRKLQDSMAELMTLKEEQDRYMLNNQSLLCKIEELELKNKELQELLNQEEQKSASVREKLNVAVRKGKSLVQQRDGMKQVIEELNAEVEGLKSKTAHAEKIVSEYEERIKNLSTAQQRVLVMESENAFLRDRLADTEQFLQEKEGSWNSVLDTLNDIDVGISSVAGNPVEKLKDIGRCLNDLRTGLESVEQESRKSKRAAELLLAELNEVQERNDGLQEELEKAAHELSELSREKDLSESAKLEALARVEKLSNIQSEKDRHLSELMVLKSGVDHMKEDFFSIEKILDHVLSKDLELLHNLEAVMKTLVKLGGTPDFGVLFPGGFPGGITSTKSENKVFMAEIGSLRERLYSHSHLLQEKASLLSEVVKNVHNEYASQGEACVSMKRELKQLELIVKEKESESQILRQNMSLLYETYGIAISEIENRKNRVGGNSLAVRDPQNLHSQVPVERENSSTTNIHIFNEEGVKAMHDKLLLVVRDLIDMQNELMEGGQKEMKSTILNLQKELQEKDIQRDRICVELVNQIKEAETNAKNYLHDLQEARIQLHDLQRHVDVMAEEREALEQRMNELQDQGTSCIDLQQKVNSLTEAIAAKVQETEALMQALDEQEAEMEDLADKVRGLESELQQKNRDLEHLEGSRAKVLKKLSVTVSKFDELHYFSESLLSEVEKLQSQLQERDGEISFLRQEVTRCTNDAIAVTQESKKRSSDEVHDFLSWLVSLISRGQVHDTDNIKIHDVCEYKEVLQKQITDVIAELENLRVVAQNSEILLQEERNRVEELAQKEQYLKNSLTEKESQLLMLRTAQDSAKATESTSEIMEVEPMSIKWASSGTIAPQVRSLRKTNNDQVAIDMDQISDSLDEDDDKAHGFKSLTTSKIVPRFTRPVSDIIDGLWMSCDRALMRQPALRLGVILYWAVMHALLATFVV